MSFTNNTSTTQKAVLAIGAIILLSIFGAAPAMAKACKNVHIEVKNASGKSITVYDLDYWDSESEKWRSEPVKNTPISNNRTWQINRNLERVNGQSVKVRVQYKYKYKKYNKLLKRWKWKTARANHVSGSITCSSSNNPEFVLRIR